ncbi:MAG TPA: DUF5615 family PIN-like protein [Phycisphaerales bacterium]|nr:DUF5615 family PIN-like protein [Phycisphaerales bacterium]
MKVWLDAHISADLVPWIKRVSSAECESIVALGLERESDHSLFEKARQGTDVLITKDSDFVSILRRRGKPPAVILLTCGNTSNAHLRELLGRHLTKALDLIRSGESLVEIG